MHSECNSRADPNSGKPRFRKQAESDVEDKWIASRPLPASVECQSKSNNYAKDFGNAAAYREALLCNSRPGELTDIDQGCGRNMSFCC